MQWQRPDLECSRRSSKAIESKGAVSCRKPGSKLDLLSEILQRMGAYRKLPTTTRQCVCRDIADGFTRNLLVNPDNHTFYETENDSFENHELLVRHCIIFMDHIESLTARFYHDITNQHDDRYDHSTKHLFGIDRKLQC